MAFRFRKSFKVLPGVSVNLGKRGASVSLGRRGARVTVGPRGTTTSLGIPGTGLSHRSRASRGRSGSSDRSSSGSAAMGLRGCLVLLSLFASCLVCVASGGRGSSSRRSAEASASTPVSEHQEPVESQEQGLAAAAPAVVHAFGDGAACRALGSCRVLEAPTGDSGTTWSLASANSTGDGRIALLVDPDGGRIASVGITGDPSGDLAALVLGDLHVPEGDRVALAWHMREQLRSGALAKAKSLCAVGICVEAGLDAGEPVARLRLDPTIAADLRSMKRAARAAASAAQLEARRRAEERPSDHRLNSRAHGAKPRRQAKEESARPSPPMRSCCKYCSTGIPCGDTCIAANRTCRKGRGCAC